MRRCDLAIVVDVTHETGSPGVEINETGKHKFGEGPVIGREPILNPVVFDSLSDTATREQIPFTIAASGRVTGNDADVIHLRRGRNRPRGAVEAKCRHGCRTARRGRT
jgi:endoglucanase